VARHIFQACPVWIYTQSNITQANNDNILTYQTIYCLIIVAEQYSSRENELYYVILQIPVTSSLKKVPWMF
jgi:hypothetical protein